MRMFLSAGAAQLAIFHISSKCGLEHVEDVRLAHGRTSKKVAVFVMQDQQRIVCVLRKQPIVDAKLRQAGGTTDVTQKRRERVDPFHDLQNSFLSFSRMSCRISM